MFFFPFINKFIFVLNFIFLYLNIVIIDVDNMLSDDIDNDSFIICFFSFFEFCFFYLFYIFFY